MDRAEIALGAGRNRIFSGQSLGNDDGLLVFERLNALGQAWSADTGARFSFDIKEERPLRLDVASLVERILSEAIVNAFRHAGASQVTLHVRFDHGMLHCSVLDDGTGIPPDFLERPPVGHLGLRLMRDRATTIGGSLQIQRGVAAGSAIVLTLPSRKAYLHASLWRRIVSSLSSMNRGAADRIQLPRGTSAVHE